MKPTGTEAYEPLPATTKIIINSKENPVINEMNHLIGYEITFCYGCSFKNNKVAGVPDQWFGKDVTIIQRPACYDFYTKEIFSDIPAPQTFNPTDTTTHEALPGSKLSDIFSLDQ